MRQSNFALRLQPSLYEAARELAKEEGVALNQLINVAVAQMLAVYGASSYIALRARRADVPRALAILQKAGRGNPPDEGDELPEGWSAEMASAKLAPNPVRARAAKSQRTKSQN